MPKDARDAAVKGEIVAGERGADLREATVVVRVEESSRADAPSTVVAESVLTRPWADGGRAIFSLVVPAVDPKAIYRVTASVDLDGDGEIGHGDFLTTVSYPVLTRGNGTHVVVSMQRVE